MHGDELHQRSSDLRSQFPHQLHAARGDRLHGAAFLRIGPDALRSSPRSAIVGNGVCRPDTTGQGQAPVLPSQVHLDPTKRYYISVLPGDAANPFESANAIPGHGMGGAPIAFPPAECDRHGACRSRLRFQPAKLSVFVFEDDFPLNGEQDAGGGVDVLSPNEPGLGGFNITLFDDAGGTGDATGQMTYDMFNMPLSNSLAGTIDPSTGMDACPISAGAHADRSERRRVQPASRARS